MLELTLQAYTDAFIFNHTAEAHTLSPSPSIHQVHYSSFNTNINYREAVNSGTYLLIKNFTRNQLRRCNVPPNHRPACSSISQQRCHPRAGHDSPRIKGTSRLTHSQDTQKH